MRHFGLGSLAYIMWYVCYIKLSARKQIKCISKDIELNCWKIPFSTSVVSPTRLSVRVHLAPMKMKQRTNTTSDIKKKKRAARFKALTTAG